MKNFYNELMDTGTVLISIAMVLVVIVCFTAEFFN